VERRERVTESGSIWVNWQQEEPADLGGRRQPSTGGTSRVTGDGQARICERLGVKFPGPTRHVETAAWWGFQGTPQVNQFVMQPCVRWERVGSPTVWLVA
jgi:hypothetical protein